MDGITELEENDGIAIENCIPCYQVKEVISYATEIIGKIGYFNSKSDLPTKYLVRCLLTRRLNDAIKLINEALKKYKVEFSKNDFFMENTEKLYRTLWNIIIILKILVNLFTIFM